MDQDPTQGPLCLPGAASGPGPVPPEPPPGLRGPE